MKNYYTYKPFGEAFATECIENVSNPFKFTGQFFDGEIDEYHLRARMYDPQIARFTSRDPVFGSAKEPMALHKYLYCNNDPVNRTDPEGRFAYQLANPIITGSAFYGHAINLAAYGASSGDLRFFDLAAATGKFMKYAMGLAAANPLGPYDRIAAYFGESVIERAWGSRTGFTWEEALAVDVFAYGAYYVYMLGVHDTLGTDVTDMEDFMYWKRGFWQ